MKTVRFLFNDAMARAIVEGRKTVTRRPVRDVSGDAPPADAVFRQHHMSVPAAVFDTQEFGPNMHWSARMPCAPGDLLIGRECWRLECTVGAGTEWAMSYRSTGTTRNFSTYNDPDLGERCSDATIKSGCAWRPSIHMPDWAARIRRRVVSVTVERLHDVTDEDAVREGFDGEHGPRPPFGNRRARANFIDAWESIYAVKGLGSDTNPWVWRVEFSAESVAP